MSDPRRLAGFIFSQTLGGEEMKSGDSSVSQFFPSGTVGE